MHPANLYQEHRLGNELFHKATETDGPLPPVKNPHPPAKTDGKRKRIFVAARSGTNDNPLHNLSGFADSNKDEVTVYLHA
jgi:hypothetical protein